MMFDGWYGLILQDWLLYVGVFNWIFMLGMGLMDLWIMGVMVLILVKGIILVQILLIVSCYGVMLIVVVLGVFCQMLCVDWLVWLGLCYGLMVGEWLDLILCCDWQFCIGIDLYEVMGMFEVLIFILGSFVWFVFDGYVGFFQLGWCIVICDG